MPQYCSVPKCKSKNGGHKFPTNNIAVRTKWIIAVKRKGHGKKSWQPSKHSVVCRKHFTSQDFYPTSDKRRRLFPHAVPSIFPFKKAKKQRKKNRNCTATKKSGKSAKEPQIQKHENGVHELLKLPILQDDDVPMGANVTIMPIPLQGDISVSAAAEVDHSIDSIDDTQNKSIAGRANSAMFDIENFKNNDADIKYYTGFRDFNHFSFVFNILGEAKYHLNYQSQLGAKNEFFIAMLKLRQAKDDHDLSVLFGVSETTISRIVSTWINFMYYQFREITIWPSKETVQAHMPSDFAKKFPNTRVILDATEIPTEKPSDVLMQSASFSTYKNHNTLKTMIGCSPRGAVTFISDSYGGSSSDRQIIERSCLVTDPQMFGKKESIMADRGLNVQDIFAPRDVYVNIPNFLRGKSQLLPDQVNNDRKIASKRIHVERIIGLAKRFKILKKDLPCTKLLVGGKIIYICFMLTNFLPCIVSEFA